MPLTLTAINVGTSPGSGNGDPGRTAFQTTNTNFALVAGAVEDAEIKAFVVGCTGKGVDLAVEESIEYWHMPYSFVLLDVKAGVDVAPVGADIVIDILEGGVSVLGSGGLVIADGATTNSVAEVVPYTILNTGSKMTIDVNQIGSTTAGQWLKVSLIGYVVWTSF